MADTTSPKMHRRDLFRSLLVAAIVVGCATVTLRVNLPRNPLADTLVLALGICFMFLDGTSRGWWQFRDMPATAGTDPAQAETAVANTRMVAGELRRWFLIFVISTTTATLVDKMLSKIVSSSPKTDQEHILELARAHYSAEDLAQRLGITTLAFEYKDMCVAMKFMREDKDGAHVIFEGDHPNPKAGENPLPQSDGRIEVVVQNNQFDLVVERKEGSATNTMVWGATLPELSGWQFRGWSSFLSQRGDTPITSTTVELCNATWVKPLPPEAPPDQKQEQLRYVLYATFSRT